MALYVVQGPPCGGKTTWVRQHAQPGDIVVDLDAIAAALTVGHTGHDHPPPLLRCAQRARMAALDEALRHTTAIDVYLIHAMPSARVTARYERHGAHMITCDPGRDVIEERVRRERPREVLDVVARWYARTGVTDREDEPEPVINSRSW